MAKKQRPGVRRLASGRYQARYTHGGVAFTQAAHGLMPFVSDAEAADWLLEIKLSIRRGTWKDPRKPVRPAAAELSVAEWTARFLKSHTEVKLSTQATNRSIFRNQIEAGVLSDISLADLTKTDVREWLAALPVGASRKGAALSLLSMALEAAFEDELVGKNAAKGIKYPRVPDPNPVILSEQMAFRLVHELPERYRLLALVLTFAQLRFGEGAGLRRRSVSAKRRLLLVDDNSVYVPGTGQYHTTPKSGKGRSVQLPPTLMDELIIYAANEDPEWPAKVERARATFHFKAIYTDQDLPLSGPESLLFPSTTGRPLRNGVFQTAFKNAAARVGAPAGITVHDLRATGLTWIADGLGIMHAAKQAGHARDGVTLKHYVRPRDENGDRVALFLEGRLAEGRKGQNPGEESSPES